MPHYIFPHQTGMRFVVLYQGVRMSHETPSILSSPMLAQLRAVSVMHRNEKSRVLYRNTAITKIFEEPTEPDTLARPCHINTINAYHNSITLTKPMFWSLWFCMLLSEERSIINSILLCDGWQVRASPTL